MTGEATALNVINKINKPKVFKCSNRFLTAALRCLLCNALIQHHFDYACSVWYPNLPKQIKPRIQATQNKCMHFYLQLDKLWHISHVEFECLKLLYRTYIFKQCVNSTVFKGNFTSLEMFIMFEYTLKKKNCFTLEMESSF